MLLAAQGCGWRLWYLEVGDLFLHEGLAQARGCGGSLSRTIVHWYDLGDQDTFPLSRTDVVLIRKDPPLDMEYMYATYLLELAEAAGVLVVNAPQGLRDANEKLFTAWFPHCCLPGKPSDARAHPHR